MLVIDTETRRRRERAEAMASRRDQVVPFEVGGESRPSTSDAHG